MKQSQLFTKTRKDAPSDEVSKNAQLLIRAGFIHKEMAGVYSWLPLGLKVINNIKRIVDEEMRAMGSVELLMSTLQNKNTWTQTGRWDDQKVDVWFKSNLKNDTEVGFGWSHEEPITQMMRDHVASYNDLPRVVHQFQNKLRNETRAKSGVMRGREFIMKDMYSYATSNEEHLAIYNRATEAYNKVFERLSLGDDTYITSASGGAFTSNFSHEFQTLCDAGEDTIYVHKTQKLAVNEEIFNDETMTKLGTKKEDYEARTAAEVGNIFTFGTEKCEQMGLTFKDATGATVPAFLGSYGIGITRVMGVVVEKFADDKGMVWPESVAPFAVHLVELSQGNEEIKKTANDLYADLTKAGVEVLYDDRDARAGEKFADSDLIGIPYRIVVGKHTTPDSIEVVRRKDGTVTQHLQSAILSGTYAT